MGFGIATQTGVSAAIQSIPSFMSNSGLRNGYGATFYENFIDGTNTLDPRITFSRASNATVTNSSGLIVNAPMNLLTFSEQFDNAAWTKRGTCTVVANDDVAPNGTRTADRITFAGATNDIFFASLNIAAGTPLSPSIYIKKSTSTGTFRLDSANGTSFGSWTVNLALLSTGWERLTSTHPAVTQTTAFTGTGNNFSGFIMFTPGGTTVTAWFWGAQLELRNTASTYNSTTVKNLVGFSEAFDNAAWTKSNSTVSANTTVTAAPNGTFTADKLVSTATTSIQQITQFSFVTQNASPYSFSVYVKAAEYTFARIRSFEGSPFARAVFIDVNLTTGAVVRTDATGGAVLTSSSVTDVGNGWYRASLTFTIGGAGTAIAGQIILNDGTNNFNITGNGTSGIYLWGAQLSDSASLDTYVNNPVAAPSSTAFYGARFDYDPVTLQPKGLLIEEQRTNLLLQSESFDNATNWAASNTTVTANNTVSPDGTQDAERIAENTANTNHHVGQVVTLSGSTTYSLSVYAKVGTSNFIGLTLRGAFGNYGAVEFNVNTGVVSRTSVLGTGYAVASSSITNVGNGWYRCVATVTTGTSVGAGRFYTFMSNGSAAFDSDGMPSYTGTSSTVFVWGAQLEAGAFATSYIPTTSAQVTRSADVALIQGSNFSGWFNQTEGTIFGVGTTNATAGAVKCAFHIAKTNNAVGYQYVINTNGASSGFNIYNDANAYQGTPPYPAVSGSQLVKFAGAYKTNDSNAVITVNATQNTAATTTSVTLPTALIQMNIGAAQTTQTSYWNGHIRSLAYYPTRLQNSQLQAITQ